MDEDPKSKIIEDQNSNNNEGQSKEDKNNIIDMNTNTPPPFQHAKLDEAGYRSDDNTKKGGVNLIGKEITIIALTIMERVNLNVTGKKIVIIALR